MKPLRSLLCCFVLLAGTAGVASADVEATIAKARAFIAKEEALNSLRSIRYKAIVEWSEKEEDGTLKPVSYGLEIIFKKDYQHRLTVIKEGRKDVTALNEYEAWRMSHGDKEGWSWPPLLLGKDQVKQFRASCWQNLAFFRGIEAVGGKVEDGGIVDLDGAKAHKLAFVHAEGIQYIRYFDPQTGKLLLTETDQGRIREQGEMTVQGIRFPRQILNTPPEGADGRVMTIRIEEVAVNEEFSDDLFSVPLMPPR